MTHIAIPEVFYITLALWLLTQFMHQTQMSSYPSSYSREKRKKKLQNVTICIRLKQWHNPAGPCCAKKKSSELEARRIAEKTSFPISFFGCLCIYFQSFLFYEGSAQLWWLG